MWLNTFFFYSFALLALGGGILTITRKSAIHSAISLIVSLMGVAGLFLMQRAEFLFVTQIVLYVGGIMVLFLFVIMLVNLEQAAKVRQFSRQWPVALLCVICVGALGIYFLNKGAASFQIASPAPGGQVAGGNVQQIADTLFSQYLLPFEVASILLLVAVVGAVIMAKKRA